MNADSGRSVPLIETILNSQKLMRLKRQALFMLPQSGNPKAQELIGKIAKGNENVELQKMAIHNLGIGGKHNAPILEDLYKSAPDILVQKEILHGLFVGGVANELVLLARA